MKRLLIAIVALAGLATWAWWPVAEPAEDPEEALKELSSLGYVSWVDADQGGDGLRVREPGADDGLLLFTSRPRASAHLIDRDGGRVHAWDNRVGGASWNHVELAPNGDLLAMQRYHALMRLDRDSQIIWRRPLGVHHDIEVAPDGRIRVLDADRRDLPTGPILDNAITELGADGQVLRRFWLSEVLSDPKGPLARRVPRHLRFRQRATRAWIEKDPNFARDVGHDAPLAARPGARLRLVDKAPDALHVNSFETLPERAGLWPAGAVLISVRELDLIAVVGLAEARVYWAWGHQAGEDISRQHHATYLDNGHILLLDNGRPVRTWSRVLEIHPETRKVVWSYEDPDRFYTGYRGSAQRLPNGNTLVCASDGGRIFEVTRSGEVVWEYHSRDARDGPQGKRQRAALYRVERVEPPPWLKTGAPTIPAGTGTSK